MRNYFLLLALTTGLLSPIAAKADLTNDLRKKVVKGWRDISLIQVELSQLSALLMNKSG
tara:strand:- start:207 stop:383 length:177 start_codon:yes stop_codon:yes gene_type:complete